jgi:dipeptidyl aminopeptidase/acylaminoacyl peptidase
VRKSVWGAIFLVVFSFQLCAQQDKQSEREAMYYRYLEFHSYIKGGSIEPHWMADGSSFWYAEGSPENTIIWKVDPVANTKEPLFDTARLREVLTRALGHAPPHRGLPFSEFSFVDGEQAVKFRAEDKESNLRLGTFTITVMPFLSEEEKERVTPKRGEVVSPDGRWIATVKDYNLWLKSTEDGSEMQLTSDGIEDYEWWLGASPLSGQDMVKWSPDSSTLAIKKVDYRRIPKIPLVDWLGLREEVEWSYFDRKPGQPIAQAELFHIDIRSGKRVRVDVGGEPEQHMFLVQWSPGGSELLFFRRGSYRPNLVLMAAEARTGSTRVVLVEEHPVRFRGSGPRPGETPFTLHEDGKRFLWLSGRTGWRHLYLYDLSGDLIRAVTQGEFPVERVVRMDEAAGWVYFTARDDPQWPYDTHLYRVSLEGKGLTRLTEAPGQHDIRFAPSGQFFLDTHSSVDRPPAVELRRADGKLLQSLAIADITALKDELRWIPPEEFVVRAAGGKADLYGVLYKPFDFDPEKKYPVILHASRAGRTFFGRGVREAEFVWPQAMAQLGFIVFEVDVREPQLSWRGGEFDRVTAGTIGRYEVPDYVAALTGLAAERPYMDLSRVGVFGGSYGGYHAIRAMLQAPDVFHVGVAVNAITDSYGHPNFYVLGSPQENNQAFEEASNLTLAGNLKGKLRLVHGTQDTSVPFSHAMKMVDALTRAGKPYDLIVLPGWGHWYPDTEVWERYRLEAYRRYFQEHLEP